MLAFMVQAGLDDYKKMNPDFPVREDIVTHPIHVADDVVETRPGTTTLDSPHH